jgi:phosphatidylserine/phosphatidylglycerophosphate/cardiolipin synthase-like enzyme
MRHRPQPRTIAWPVRLTGLRVVTTATLAGSPARGPTVTGCCTPRGLCSDVHAKHLGKATSRSLVQAYRFTLPPIATVLVDASKRGVEVESILDTGHRTDQDFAADCLANQGVPTMIDDNHAIAHTKVMNIDGAFVSTGSFTFTKAAQEKNAENVLIIRDQALAAHYTQN